MSMIQRLNFEFGPWYICNRVNDIDDRNFFRKKTFCLLQPGKTRHKQEKRRLGLDSRASDGVENVKGSTIMTGESSSVVSGRDGASLKICI